MQFTLLERAVFVAICDRDETLAGPLRRFIETARPRERDNTGHGFFTSFDVDKSISPLDWPTRYLDGPDATVTVGSETLHMGFILWLEGGYPECLEGFQYGTPSGGDIDLKPMDLSELRWIGPTYS